MPEPLPVTDEDVKAAFDAYHNYSWHGLDYVRPFDPRDHLDQHVLQQLRTVLENDRKRVAERSL